MVSSEKMKIDMRKIGLKREAFCKKMWAEIEKKRSDFRKEVEKYREKLGTRLREESK